MCPLEVEKYEAKKRTIEKSIAAIFCSTLWIVEEVKVQRSGKIEQEELLEMIQKKICLIMLSPCP
jgi:hypothetical protein